MRSNHTQNLLDHVIKGIDQIERSAAPEGMVCLHLTPRLLQAGLWPEGGYPIDWAVPATMAGNMLTRWVSEIVIDNGQAAVDALFAGKKAAGTVHCIGLFPTVARNPKTGNAIVMPIKVVRLVDMVPGQPLSTAFRAEIDAAHHRMQTQLL